VQHDDLFRAERASLSAAALRRQVDLPAAARTPPECAAELRPLIDAVVPRFRKSGLADTPSLRPGLF